MVDIRSSEAPENSNIGLYIPPHSNEAEQAVLGAILHDNRTWDRVHDLLAEQDFYRAAHRAIWRAIEQLMDKNKPADPITVLDMVDDDARAELAGFLGEIPSLLNARQHAEIVRSRSILRQLISAGIEIQSAAMTHGVDAQETAENAEALVLAVMDKNKVETEREPVPLYGALARAVDWLDEERTGGLSTGYKQIDDMLPGNGFQPESLIVVAGRPSMGKSALCLCMAEHAAYAGKTVAYFSLESSIREIGVRSYRWHESNLGRAEALRAAARVPLLIDDSPAIGLSHIRVRCRRIRRRQGLHMIMVDYLQLMRQRAQSRLEEISEISRGLKAIAKEFGVVVVAVSQLNRSVEQRPDKRPLLSDLRESGQIEQDADVVLMCYRDEYYNPASPEKGLGDVFVRKNRDGSVGGALLAWNGPLTRWTNFSGERPVTRETVLAGDSRAKGFSS